jgi:hypothetical protein
MMYSREGETLCFSPPPSPGMEFNKARIGEIEGLLGGSSRLKHAISDTDGFINETKLIKCLDN